MARFVTRNLDNDSHGISVQNGLDRLQLRGYVLPCFSVASAPLIRLQSQRPHPGNGGPSSTSPSHWCQLVCVIQLLLLDFDSFPVNPGWFIKNGIRRTKEASLRKLPVQKALTRHSLSVARDEMGLGSFAQSMACFHPSHVLLFRQDSTNDCYHGRQSARRRRQA